MLQQMSSTDPCAGSGWGWAVVGVGIAETTTALVVRAFALRLELIVFASVMVFTILAEIVALLNPNAVNVAIGLSTVAAVLQIFSILYGAFEHFLLRFRVSRLNASLQTNSNDSLFQTNNDQLFSPLLASSFDDQRSLDATVTTSSLIHMSVSEESQRVNDALENMIEMICAGRSVL
ncbi:transmembrane protein, putative [Bodo saltans]|uniref:Transmembrane protein, putative n=1 Tax=Bodo saltans TaxID=75058 RepID=A0A0S4J2X0_BODSA|nr:transmembrane protein, putative [Bodo saltans]|eukprot:CUG29669.1 transmembrane protein, putative [Bodo saltans]